jgi:hypothetical protein
LSTGNPALLSYSTFTGQFNLNFTTADTTRWGKGTVLEEGENVTLTIRPGSSSAIPDTVVIAAAAEGGSGTTETASEGLIKEGSDIKLGNSSSGSTTGELTADRYVPLGGRTLNFRNGRLSLQSSASAIPPLLLGNNGGSSSVFLEIDRSGLSPTNDIFTNFRIVSGYYNNVQPSEPDSINDNKVTTWGTNLSQTGGRLDNTKPAYHFQLEENFIVSGMGRTMEVIETFHARSGFNKRVLYSLFPHDGSPSLEWRTAGQFGYYDWNTGADIMSLSLGNHSLFNTPTNYYKVPDADDLVIKQATSGSVLRPLLGLSSDNSIRHGYGGTLHEFFGNNIYYEPVSTATRWAGNVAGMFRFNQDSLRFEANDGGQWRTFAWKSDVTGGGGGGGLSDADYGDITVSGSGSTMTIDNGAVMFAKMQDISTQRLLGRSTSGSGVIEELQIQGPLKLASGFLSLDGNMSGSSTITANGNDFTLNLGADKFIMHAADAQFKFKNTSSTGAAALTFENNSGHKVQQFYTGSAWTYRNYGVKSLVTYNIQNNTAPFVIMDNDNVIIGTGGNNLVDGGQKFQVYGTSLFTGIASYGSDLSSGYTSRSLVDKGYVDAAITAAAPAAIYATYTLNADKTFSAANTAEVITLDTENLESGVTHTGSSEEVTLPTAGVYIFTAQMHASSSGTDAVKFCLQKWDGDSWENVANSSTVIPLLSTGAFPGGWSFHVNATANDKYRFVASATSTNVTLNAIAAADEVAAVPAFRVTIHKL